MAYASKPYALSSNIMSKAINVASIRTLYSDWRKKKGL
jgi:hypothetical protein